MRAPLCPIIRYQSRTAQPRYNVATSPRGLAPRQALISVKRVLQRLAKPIDPADSLLPDDAVGEPSTAAWALDVPTSQGRRKCTRLRLRHDRPEGKWGAVGVAAVRDPADRIAQDLDRRLRDVLVKVRRARLPQVLQLPGLLLTGLDVQPRLMPARPHSAWKQAFGLAPPPGSNGVCPGRSWNSPARDARLTPLPIAARRAPARVTRSGVVGPTRATFCERCIRIRAGAHKQ